MAGAEEPPVWEIAVHLAVAGDAFDGVFLYYLFSHEMSRMRPGTSLSQFLRVSLLFQFGNVGFCLIPSKRTRSVD